MEALGAVSRILPLIATTQMANSIPIDITKMIKYPTTNPSSNNSHFSSFSNVAKLTKTVRMMDLQQKKNLNQYWC